MGKLLISAILILALALGALAQDKPTITRIQTAEQQAQELLDRALVELEHCQAKGKINDGKIQGLEEQAAALAAQVDVYKQAVVDWKAAAVARAGANALDDDRAALYEKRIALFEKSLDDYRTEVASLRVERDNLRKSRTRWMLAAGVVGALITWGFTRRAK